MSLLDTSAIQLAIGIHDALNTPQFSTEIFKEGLLPTDETGS
jgi:hypothetical protein